ncbi:Uncharacterised protein [uncultured archaeon]|nr:Uncharacterised protein [uncultured archaeon]
MKMNIRKINNYSAIRISSVFILVAMLMFTTFTFPLGTQTGAEPLPNSPPYIPNHPIPANNSTGISILTKLNWTGGDPDGNNVTYDVYFGTNNTPLKIITNQSGLIYDPGTMSYLTHYYWRIIAWDSNKAKTIGPLWEFTTERKPNTPPNTPSNPTPANGATNVYLNTQLKWSGGDPDGNPTTYDVYFGTASSPPKVKSNQSTLSYDLVTLTINTKYYWKIVAWDNQSASTTGPIWSFTTKGLPTVTITRPLVNTLYIQDNEYLIDKFPLTFIYGPINITASASSGIRIAKVEFFIDGKSIGNDSVAPYICLWNPTDLKDDLSVKHTIKVVAYDLEGDSASTQLDIIKWRFHPLPFYVGGVAIGGLLLSKFLIHTTVRGLFFNVQQSMFTTSFYAVRIHFSTMGPFRHVRGVINYKTCTGGILIGPITMIRIGPLHNIAYGSFTFLGDIHYTPGSFGQGTLINLLRNPTP